MSGAFCPCPLSAAPRTSHALPSAVPRRSARLEPRRCDIEARSVDSSLSESFEASQLFWGLAPHRVSSRARVRGGAGLAPFGPLRNLRAVCLGRDAPSPERLRSLLAPSTPLRSSSRSCDRLPGPSRERPRFGRPNSEPLRVPPSGFTGFNSPGLRLASLPPAGLLIRP